MTDMNLRNLPAQLVIPESASKIVLRWLLMCHCAVGHDTQNTPPLTAMRLPWKHTVAGHRQRTKQARVLKQQLRQSAAAIAGSTVRSAYPQPLTPAYESGPLCPGITKPADCICKILPNHILL